MKIRLNWSMITSLQQIGLNMMTSSNRKIVRVTGHLCEEFTGPGEFPAHSPVTRSFDVFFDLRLNKRLRKHSWGWWFETLSCPLWRHYNEIIDRRKGVLITPMALAHPLHPIRSMSRKKRRNLRVGWCVSSWRPPVLYLNIKSHILPFPYIMWIML